MIINVVGSNFQELTEATSLLAFSGVAAGWNRPSAAAPGLRNETEGGRRRARLPGGPAPERFAIPWSRGKTGRSAWGS